MNVWVLTKETGWYSDYSMSVLAVASTADRAKELAAEFARQEHADAVATAERYRAQWPEMAAREPNSWYARHPPEVVHPMPTLTIPAWEPNPDRPGDWHSNPEDDVRWSIFQTELDALAPDGQPAYAANPDL